MNNPAPNSPDFSSLDQRLINRRQVWAANRFWMEMQNLKTRRYGNRGKHHWYQFLLLLKIFKIGLRFSGLYQRGVQNAQNICLNNISLQFENLPASFNGFRILHLSDLHLDGMKNIENLILEKTGDQEFDLCVLTGDYRTELHGLHKHIIEKLQIVLSGIQSSNGFIGILGNHDSCHMVNPLEKIGINMLVNSAHFLYRGKERIQIIGTDDVHYYYSDQALHALEHAAEDFTIALIHSLELYKLAALMGVDLYLCGHTHAGQVCLPGGKPVITHVNGGCKFYKGHWNYLKMQGYTHSGVGTSALPVRFNCRGEIAIHTLQKVSPPNRNSTGRTSRP